MNINLHELNLITIVFRIILAVLFGGIVGIERDLKNHGAGFRTYIIVCLGATLIMMTSQYTLTLYPTLHVDPTRMGAQVISGIGFLGAGTILITSAKKITGLTTAAGLWTASAIGLAIGIGFYEGAFGGVLALFIILMFFNKFKSKINGMSKFVDIYIVINQMSAYHEIMQLIASYDIQLLDIRDGLDFLTKHTNLTTNAQEICCIFSLHINNGITKDCLIKKIREIEGAQFAEEIK